MENFNIGAGSSKKKSKLPTKREINSAINSFSKKEWYFFMGLVAILILSTLSLLQNINKSFMVEVPLRGGTVNEGLIGVPRFINPILANSTADESLTNLIYSGLMRKTGNGTLIPDLAEKYDISPNGLIYTFTLRDNLTFQNGDPLTTDDILFTINTIKDGDNKSPHKVNWDGVGVNVLDEKTVQFTLKQPYASFLENSTIGIVPKKLWLGSPIELNTSNTNPVGSGPYMVKNINKQSSGVIDSYELVPFDKFALGKPYIKNLNLYFYQNEDELLNMLRENKVDQISSISPLNAENLKEENFDIQSAVLPRVFGLFFNQNQNQIFVDKSIVKIIDQAIDKDRIIKEALLGYGKVLDGPIPPNMSEYQTLTSATKVSREDTLAKIQTDLAKLGWKKNSEGILEKTTKDKKQTKTNTLSFSISTGNVEELTKVANFIKEDLGEIGINVEVKTFEIGNLNQNVIRPRKYDALLFGEIINRESDLYAFWHSSQRKDPGLNVALYTSTKVDKILEDASVTVDDTARVKKYFQFEDEIRKDVPAIFLYSPEFIYVADKDLQQYQVNSITTPEDRYLNAYLWYTEKGNVWKILEKYN